MSGVKSRTTPLSVSFVAPSSLVVLVADDAEDGVGGVAVGCAKKVMAAQHWTGGPANIRFWYVALSV